MAFFRKGIEFQRNINEEVILKSMGLIDYSEEEEEKEEYNNEDEINLDVQKGGEDENNIIGIIYI